MKISKLKKEVSLPNLVLKALQRKTLPLSEGRLLKELEKKLGIKVSSPALGRAVDTLSGAGYDIKEVTVAGQQAFSLVRFAKLDEKDYYRPVGAVKTPCLLTADWHIGSKGWSEQAYHSLLEDVDSFGIKHILHAGDMLQGLGVYRTEREDLVDYSIDDQVYRAIDYLSELPSKVKFHLIMGGHEQKILGDYKMGFDACRAIANAVKNVNYYHYVANFILNRYFRLLLIHGSGGPSYASSYILEKLWRELTERPDVLVMGHFHRLNVITKTPNKLLIEPGCLQRESIYLLRKGLTAQVGWFVLNSYNHENADIQRRMPRVF